MAITKDQIEGERLRFEKWHNEVHGYDSVVQSDGKYSIPHVERRWIIWLAAKQDEQNKLTEESK